MRKRKEYEFLIETTEFPGKGIAFYEGEKVAIKNTLPGQKVKARVTKKSSQNGVQAKLIEVLEDVDYKIKSHCDISNQCGGCSHASLDYETQLKFKTEQVKKLLDEGNIQDYDFLGIEESPVVFEYRNKMEFTFGDMEKGGELTLGMHVKNRNFSIITVDNCKIVDNDFRTILTTTLNHFKNTELPYYKVLKHEGFLRNLVVRKAINTGEILVNLVTTTQNSYDLTKFVEELKSLNLNGKIVSIIHTLNDSLSDVVQADEIKVLYGKDYIVEDLLGLKFKINPFAFFQTNTKGAEKLYSMVRDFMGDSENKIVFDLYCGTGTIGQIVAPKAKKVLGIELIEEAVDAAKENAKLNNLDNCEFIAGDVAKVIKDVKIKPDIIILDPPRAGVHPIALDYVIKFDAKEIIYVSCNPKSLVTDLQVLTNAGYKIDKIKLKDMFPHTPHVETVCRLYK
ncbi:23S rRNA (uracil(1939)-C(5))-methyltransferase RlmD [Clostridium senegalense]|uniref:23S rRNA (Uracil(1939)-C(5))-methyltransferase RlmD n=1 Tax=Clostridium senegalense TaxID=1465809 RepID=A0A6M0H771_9CLOT|nr:23S rRNA (uracil(1939)-C(5))-methyltransferase RlmD [Clostridium senegalense]NEU06387.1 23S rRNA (uracil(1939)-C(5))-methyltransferase RlmD [Clostridium senegalense]